MLATAFPEADEAAMPSPNNGNRCTEAMRQRLRNPGILPLTGPAPGIDNGLTPYLSAFPAASIDPDVAHDAVKFGELPSLAIEVTSSSPNIQQRIFHHERTQTQRSDPAG